MEKLRKHSKKTLIALVGGIVLVAGLIMVPYPGPGWLVVFAGLAILSTEFAFAKKVLDFARSRYDAWTAWLKRQPLFVKLVVLGVTGLVVVATIWLLNGFGIINALLHLNLDWLNSPLFT